MTKTEARWKYNPLIMKPISLEPVVPWSYTYYGPDPAAGVSYGCFRDESAGFELFSQGDVVYSPATGEPMVRVADASHEEIKQLMADATASASHKALFCKACQTSLSATANLEGFEEVHCMNCGAMVEVATPKQTKGKTMDTSQMQAIKDKIKAKLAASVKTVKAEEEKVEKVEEKKAKADDVAAPAVEEKKEEKSEAAEDYVSLDEILEAVGSEEAKEEEKKPEVAEESKKEEKDAKDEFLDLDMVLSSIRRKERSERISRARKTRADRMRVLAKLKARRLALAESEEEKEEEKKAKAEEKKEEAKPAVEEKKAKADEAAPAVEEAKPSEKEPDMVAQENPLPAAPAAEAPVAVEPAADAEAMKFEPLASASYFNGAKKEEVEMALYGEGSENPAWNVTVAGIPAARIQLSNQANPEEIRRVFCSEEYAMDIVEHCAKAGFVDTMHKVNAEFWANKFSDSQIAKRVKAEANEVINSEKKKMVASFREDFLHSLKVVVAGMNKNFFPIGNSLKDQLFSNMVTVGLPQQTAETVVEKSFAEGAAEYFNTLFDKATEFSGLTQEARAEISKAIGASGTLTASALENAEPATLSERLAQASVTPSVSAGFRVQSQLSVDSVDYKAQLKNAWRPKL